MTTDRYKQALQSNNVAAFLAVVRAGEGTAGPDGYRTLFGGGLFDSFADHPRQAFKSKWGWTSAAGAYQFMVAIPGKTKVDTWTECVKALNLPDFSPESQDLAAVFLIDRRKALDDVLAGRVEAAIARCADEWASLPGSRYGQPTRSLKQALKTYAEHGGVRNTDTNIGQAEWPFPEHESTPQPEKPMAPFIAAAIPALLQAAPDLIRIFGSSDNSERNAKAAELVANLATTSTGTANVQQAVEVIQAEPAKAQAFREAVQANWFEVHTATEKSVAAARDADVAFVSSGAKPSQSPAFLVSGAFYALVLLMMVDFLFVNPAAYAGQREQIITGVMGLLILIGGYWLGSSAGSSRKTEMMGEKP